MHRNYDLTLNLQTSTSTQNGISPSEPNDWKDLRTLWVIHMEAHHADLTEHNLRAQAWSRLKQSYIFVAKIKLYGLPVAMATHYCAAE